MDILKVKKNESLNVLQSTNETVIITDENNNCYDLDNMVNEINDIISNKVITANYKEFNIQNITTKQNINIFVNDCVVILKLYDDLTIIDKMQYSSSDYMRTLRHWLKYVY